MIAINVLILVVLIFENGRQLRDAASVSESNGFYSQLRRRSVSSSKSVESDVSRKINEDPEEVKIHSHVMPEAKRRIIFGLRQPQPAKATENARPQPQKSTYFNYFYNSAVAGISRALDAIDNLEKEYSEQQQQMTQMESFSLPTTRDEFINKLLKGTIKTFDNDNDDGEDEEGSDGGMRSNMTASGASFYDEEMDNVERHGHEEFGVTSVVNINDNEEAKISEDYAVSVEDEYDEASMSLITGVLESQASQNVVSETVKDNLVVSETSNSESRSVDAEQNESAYVELSESDSESWEKVEHNMIENVTKIAKRPDVLPLLDNLGNRNTLVSFFATVFVKLAKRIFLRPPVSATSSLRHSIVKSNSKPDLGKNDSMEDFITIYKDGEEGDKEAGETTNSYKFLDSKTAQTVLFYQDYGVEHDDWELIPLRSEDFNDALDFITNFEQKDKNSIEVDLPRLPQRYYSYYAERRGRELQESDADELKQKIKMILAFMMAFEAKEEISSPVAESSSTNLVIKDQRIVYSQGFDQVVAYFAINFELNLASTIAYQFFQTYMAEIISADVDSVRGIVRKIDSRAVRMIREYLRDQIGATVLNFEALLGILEIYPFSDRSATIFYFNSATSLIDLDRLIQFLLLKVPHSQAHKSISLLAAANMLYSMLTFDKLFNDELLGNEEWNQLKEHINDPTTRNRDRLHILDYLVSRFMGEIYMFMSDKIVHPAEEFDQFLNVIQSLIPYLHMFD